MYPPSTSNHHAGFGAVNLRYTRFGKVSSGDLDAEERPASVIRLLRLTAARVPPCNATTELRDDSRRPTGTVSYLCRVPS